MPLFYMNQFIAHSGARLTWKVECDALTEQDWDTLAGIVAAHIDFGDVEGVPAGGLRFADALRPFAKQGSGLLIVDDVLTTGASMEEHRAGRNAVGVVAFSRNPSMPSWVRAIWTMSLAGVENSHD